jgi:hypothetical protein
MPTNVNCSSPGCDRAPVGGFQSIVPPNWKSFPPIINGQRKLWCEEHEQELNRHLGHGRYVFPKHFPNESH